VEDVLSLREIEAETVGLVFSYHFARLPVAMKEFLEKIDLSRTDDIFAVATRVESTHRAFTDIDSCHRSSRSHERLFFENHQIAYHVLIKSLLFQIPPQSSAGLTPPVKVYLSSRFTCIWPSNGQEKQEMGDFVQQSITKTAVRELSSPVANITTFNTLVAGVVSGNPWNCTAYEIAGVAQAPVTRTREGYTARIEYEDDEAKVVGYVNARAASVAGFTSAVTAVLADTDLTTAMGGDAVHVAEDDSFSASLRCHDANGETYTVTFGRDSVRVSSYSYDAILAAIETWADTKTELS
jgi:hypothetical protein